MINSVFFRSIIFVAIIVVGVSSLLAENPRMPAGFSLQVSGQVRYADNNSPADSVLVRIESYTGGLVGQMTTDRTGKFTFNGLQPQQYIVTAHVPGYIDVSETVNLMTANTAYINARLVRDKDSVVNAAEGLTIPNMNVVSANIPLDAQNEFAKGKQLIDERQKEKINEAIKHFEKAIVIHPAYLDAQLMLGLAYMDLLQWKKAEAPLNSAIALNSAATTAYLALGEVYRQEKKYAEAEKVLVDEITLNPQSAEAHLTLAKVYWDMAPLSKTEAEFRNGMEKSWKTVSKSLAINPALAEAHLVAGNLLLKARKAPDALKHFEEYLRLDPKGPFAADTVKVVEKIKQAMATTGKG